MEKEIDYYGTSDNYIHLKFGDCRKMYHFTKDFIKNYPNFAREFANYWENKKSKFKNPFAVVNYVYDNKIPVHFYFNFTDTPAKDKKEIIEYLIGENSYVHDLKD